MFHRRSREMDPFSKTSFDALLDCLADIETPDAPMGVLSDGRDTFPGFDASGPVLAAMANSHVANSAVYQQLQQQQFQQQQQQQYQFRNNQSLMHDTDATRLGHLGFRSSMPLPRTVSMPQSSISPAALQQARLLSLASASMDRVPRSAGPTSRDSCPPSSTGSEVAFLSDGNYCNLTSHPELKRLSDGEGEPNCARQRSSDPGGDAPFLFPRTSLQSFGIHMEPPNGEPKQAASDANKPNEPERRREKNRIAQRRFRERQKTTVAVLQTELDGKQADMDQALSRIRVLEQTNWALTEKLMEYEKLFGPLPSQTPQ